MTSKHAFAVYGIFVAPRYRPRERVGLSDIGGTGISLLSVAHGLLKDISAEPIKAEKAEQYFAIDDTEPLGHHLRFGVDYGNYGLEGDIRNTRDHSITHSYTRHESAVVTVRNMIVASPGANTALFLAERYGGRGAGSSFLVHLKAAFQKKFGQDFVLHHENLIDNEAWQEFRKNARLISIKVVRYDAGHDLADGIDPRLIGQMEYEVKPRRGVQGFGNRVKDMLLSSEIKAQRMLGLREELKTDETRLVLDDGKQKRQVVIGREEAPALVYIIDHDGKERAKDDVLYGGMKQAVPALCKQLRLDLPEHWDSGEWKPEQLDVKVRAVRER